MSNAWIVSAASMLWGSKARSSVLLRHRLGSSVLLALVLLLRLGGVSLGLVLSLSSGV